MRKEVHQYAREPNMFWADSKHLLTNGSELVITDGVVVAGASCNHESNVSYCRKSCLSGQTTLHILPITPVNNLDC